LILLLVHHLAIDAVSWRIVLEDLQIAYRAALVGTAIILPEKTTAFTRWASLLSNYARSIDLSQDLPFWSAISSAPQLALPVDFPQGEDSVDSTEVVSCTLDAGTTENLIHRAPLSAVTQTDILLSALWLAFSRWTGAETLLLDLEAHGRDTFIEDADLSRTVGWFTALYPMLLQARSTWNWDSILKGIRGGLQQLPNAGLRYGLLRHLRDDLPAIRRDLKPQVSFNYLGQLDQVLRNNSLFARERDLTGAEQSLRSRRSHPLSIVSFVRDGKLRINWIYSRNVFSASSIQGLADNYSHLLHELIGHCLAPKNPPLNCSDSDFADSDFGWSDDELTQIASAIGRGV
jgi:fengycin family lipopeptide synthetase B